VKVTERVSVERFHAALRNKDVPSPLDVRADGLRQVTNTASWGMP
jgi:hypothetical protein